METSSDYLKNVSLLKGLSTTSDRRNMQAPYANAFEDVYKKAMQSDVKLDDAKSFLQSLSGDELQTLQKYDGLAEPINVGSLSSEGAYNLLMHDYEKYDFNGDGAVQDGAANMAPVIPEGMSDDVKSAYISTLNSLSDGNRLMAMSLTLDLGRLSAQINGGDYKPTYMDYSYLKNRVQDILNPQAGAYSSEDAKRAAKAFWDEFQMKMAQ